MGDQENLDPSIDDWLAAEKKPSSRKAPRASLGRRVSFNATVDVREFKKEAALQPQNDYESSKGSEEDPERRKSMGSLAALLDASEEDEDTTRNRRKSMASLHSLLESSSMQEEEEAKTFDRRGSMGSLGTLLSKYGDEEDMEEEGTSDLLPVPHIQSEDFQDNSVSISIQIPQIPLVTQTMVDMAIEEVDMEEEERSVTDRLVNSILAGSKISAPSPAKSFFDIDVEAPMDLTNFTIPGVNQPVFVPMIPASPSILEVPMIPATPPSHIQPLHTPSNPIPSAIPPTSLRRGSVSDRIDPPKSPSASLMNASRSLTPQRTPQRTPQKTQNKILDLHELERSVQLQEEMIEILAGCQMWKLEEAPSSDQVEIIFDSRFILKLFLGNFTADGKRIISRKHLVDCQADKFDAFNLNLVELSRLDTQLECLTTTDQLQQILNDMSLRLGRISELENEISRIHRSHVVRKLKRDRASVLQVEISNLQKRFKFILEIEIQVGYPMGDLRFNVKPMIGNIERGDVERLVSTVPKSYGRISKILDRLKQL
eukprot:TRINITY_DN17654_c0_g1_i1.p1 TRINITY_DN17654_c0_g1~~TRINITY_DN17654_c0_g1_i1.p1  ORF type:complete len:562 (-),score=183.58 TRINITY_DN17654_c0_g1_i1:65-1690(-)